MHRARLFASPIVRALLVVAVGWCISGSSASISSENGAVGVEPFLRLEKPRYVEGEAVRFWIGVKPKNSTVIPERFRKPCSLSISKPNSPRTVESVSWPVDGMPDHGWSGGWGLGKEKAEPGHYSLILECAGEKTPPVELIVERSEILRKIKAEFRFERDGAITKDTEVPVVMAVQNDSVAVIRFPRRGAMMEGVSLRIVRKEPAFQSEFFFPWEKLSSSTVMPDTYTSDAGPEIPSVVLQPGEHFEQRFLLKDAYSFDRTGDYEVTFATVLSVLVGERSGPFADLCPIRLPVTAIAKFVLSSAETNSTARYAKNSTDATEIRVENL
jgi:hypothetical protein